MSDVFISYAREDQLFVRALCASLEARQRTAWVDWEGIPPTAEWLVEIEAAIDAADAFLFVMSPDSLASEVCALELDYAARHNKRLVPVVRRETDGPPPTDALVRLNWIFMRERDDVDAAVATLIDALDTDLAHVKLHTHYLGRAIEWERKRFDNSYTLRGGDLAAAESWLANSGGKAPQPTSLHNRHILYSRRATTRRQRVTSGAIAFGVLVAVVLGVLGLQEREAKRQNQQRAIANQLVGGSRLAMDERDDGLTDSVWLAAEAMRRLDDLGERSLAVDQAMRSGLALLPRTPLVVALEADGETRAVGFSAGGAYMAIGTSLGRILVVDLVERRTISAWTVPTKAGVSLRAIAVDASGTRVAVWHYASSEGRSRLSLWDAARAIELHGCDREGDFKNSSPQLGPQGRLWIDQAIWDLDTCLPLTFWDQKQIVGPIALNADGRRFAASVRATGERERWIEVRDAASGDLITRWRHPGAVSRLWWIDSGRQLAGVSIGGRNVVLWDVTTPDGRPSAVRFAEPVSAVVSGAAATLVKDAPVVRIRSTATGAEIQRLAHPGPVRAAAFSADGEALSVLVGAQLWHWPLTRAQSEIELGPAATRRLTAPDGAPLPDVVAARLQQEGQTVVASTSCPDSRTLAVTSGSAKRAGWQAHTELWSMPQAERLLSFDLMETIGSGMRGLDDDAASVLACSADGRLLAMPARDAVVVREVAGGRLVALLPHPGLRAVAFTPDGAFMATGGRGPVRIWQLDTGAEVARLLDETPVDRLAFSDDGRVLATRAADHTATHLWQPRQMIDEACGRLRRPLSPETWRRLLPEVAYVDTCAASGAAIALTR